MPGWLSEALGALDSSGAGASGSRPAAWLGYAEDAIYLVTAALLAVTAVVLAAATARDLFRGSAQATMRERALKGPRLAAPRLDDRRAAPHDPPLHRGPTVR